MARYWPETAVFQFKTKGVYSLISSSQSFSFLLKLLGYLVWVDLSEAIGPVLRGNVF